MCGIIGCFSKRANIDLAVIKSMNDTIRHRGPDGEGFLIAGQYQDNCQLPKVDYIASPLNFALAHRRLAIQDLSELGHQPMQYKRRYWIVFNGEIYNFIELRAELEQNGYTFVSHTDTEVIMAAYDYWGKDCVTRFNGMWALVLYDAQQQKLFISRDRFGIKPLYYYQDNEHFIFGSEVKALLQHPIVRQNTAPDIEQCKDFLKNGPKEYIKETHFENIYRFNFGSSYEISLDKLLKQAIQEEKYWQLTPNLSNEPYNEAKAEQYAKKYYDLLTDAVRLRLRADVKVGSALSGGLDSSSIVYLINQQLKQQRKTERQETFSSVYKSEGTQDCDESVFINELAENLQVKSNQIEPKTEDIPTEHQKMIWAMDTLTDSTCMSGWHTFKCVSGTDITVTLDGQGADEQQAGYLKYLIYYFGHLPVTSLFREYKRFSAIPTAKKPIIQAIFVKLASIFITKKGVLYILQKLNKQVNPFVPLNQKLSDDVLTDLIDLIQVSDKVSMAHSIESRMPFMDYRLVELFASVPASLKLHNGWTKYIARKAFDNKLLNKITWRKDKMGWPIPEDYWFRGVHKEWFCKTIEESAFLKEQLSVGQDIRKRINSGESINQLIRLLNIAVWHKTFFDKNDA
jgi:asparagine synthase (glutamine-hydrolysing)